jgi:beta-lactamase superfamily II metal-dependent hydrolase
MLLDVLPARHGDALWLSYGPNRRHRILIDGGPRSKETTSMVRELLENDPKGVRLIVVSHIDADHITGVLNILTDRKVSLRPGDIWFNGWQHLPTDVLGAKQGEQLSDAISKRQLPWNRAFGEGPVVVPHDGPLPTVPVYGGLLLTLLSPTSTELAALKPVWEREVKKAGLVPGISAKPQPAAPDLLGEHPLDFAKLAGRPFRPDHSEANGASIAMLAEFEGRSLLLTGDAHPTVLAPQLRRLAAQRNQDRVKVDVVKLPHHGSRYNLNADLVSVIDCERWVFSTDGSIFGHPDPETVARIVVDRPGMELLFNYRSETTDWFGAKSLSRAHKYRSLYPDRWPGIQVEI